MSQNRVVINWLPLTLIAAGLVSSFPADGLAQGTRPVTGFTKTLLEQQKRQAQFPAGPVPPPIPFTAVEPPGGVTLNAPDVKFDAPPRDWKFMVLHHSATSQGSVASIHQEHRSRVDANGNPWRGIAYHFVIGNGAGMPDGQVKSTFRWDEQLEGAHAGEASYNAQGIGICLIGNFDEHPPTAAQLQAVRSLVATLRKKFDLPAKSVVGHNSFKATNCPGKYFPFTDVMISAETAPQTAHNLPGSQLKNEDAPAPDATFIR